MTSHEPFERSRPVARLPLAAARLVPAFLVPVCLVLAAAALPAAADDAPPEKVNYACAGSKTIVATYHADQVDLALSDGRSFTLPQVMSGSGTRYANKDESLVFWSKGDDAFLTEGDPEKPTYADCFGEAHRD
jgi:membrane-bound inhibitor of C-type lysozyme